MPHQQSIQVPNRPYMKMYVDNMLVKNMEAFQYVANLEEDFG